MERRESLERMGERTARRGKENDEEFGGLGIWSVVGGIALLGVAALVISTLPDLKRYIKISRM